MSTDAHKPAKERLLFVECPRDAMQGIERFISTDQKIAYINSLMEVGFDVLDCASFVSPKAVPQLADSAEVLRGIEPVSGSTPLLAIVGNERGAREASQFEVLAHLGFPFGISEEFQRRNLGSSILESTQLTRKLLDLCADSNKHLVVYLSMAFGNPYGEDWSVHKVNEYVGELQELGVDWISLSDTVGMADADLIASVYSSVRQNFPTLELGLHLHARPDQSHAKIKAAWNVGCRRFDSAMLGFGGCPFAEDDLVGNIPSEKLLSFAESVGAEHSIQVHRFQYAYNQALKTFPAH